MDDTIRPDELRGAVTRLSRDLVKAAATLSEEEARYLVDGYYMMQDSRKRADNQLRSMQDEPHEILGWFGAQADIMEGQVKRALDVYSDNHAVGLWMKSLYGIGPVLAAGLLAHIDIKQAPTAGHVWRFAGLDPSSKWGKGEKRPWNAELRTLTWKCGQSFMKFSGNENCVYGHTYKERKSFEVARNERGDNTARAAEILKEKNWAKGTEAYKHLTKGRLPPAQIDARARRYAVKLFLSHLQTVWWFVQFRKLPASPYAMGKLDHAHFIPLPNASMIDGLESALRKGGWQ
jgi:hypothetical protein